MRIAIVGAGIAGLSAAYDLAGQGYAVTIYEAGDQSVGWPVAFAMQPGIGRLNGFITISSPPTTRSSN